MICTCRGGEDVSGSRFGNSFAESKFYLRATPSFCNLRPTVVVDPNIFGFVECIESEEFEFAKSLIAGAASVDEALGKLLFTIAQTPTLYPIVVLPDTSLGVTHTCFGSVAVVYRVHPDGQSVLLTHPILKRR